MMGGMHGMGACVAGRDMHDRGCVAGGRCGKGVCVVWGACMAWEHAWQEDMRGRRDGHCSERYASYWNAFLFF